MNNQNKKNKISLQGYYAASGIEFLNVMIHIMKDNKFIATHDILTYNHTINYLVSCFHKSIHQNMNSINNSIKNNELKDKLMSVFIDVW